MTLLRSIALLAALTLGATPAFAASQIQVTADNFTVTDAKREALTALTPEHDGVSFRGDAYNPSEYLVRSGAQVHLITPKRQEK